MVWNIHVDDSNGNHTHYMILGHDISFKLRIDLCLFNNTIRVNEGTYKKCTTTMKEVSKINLNMSSNWFQDKKVVTKNCGREKFFWITREAYITS